MGLHEKFGVDGSRITNMNDNNQINEISNYCETDVLNTYLVYLRHMLHRGTLCKGNYNHAAGDIISLLEAKDESRPLFLSSWIPGGRPLVIILCFRKPYLKTLNCKAMVYCFCNEMLMQISLSINFWDTHCFNS